MDYWIYALGIVLVLVSAGVVALYLRGAQVDGTGFFSTRYRRLMVTERLSLEGGRRLLIVRRDNAEHLILIGGPIDIVIETHIRPAEELGRVRADVLELGQEMEAAGPFPGAREPAFANIGAQEAARNGSAEAVG